MFTNDPTAANVAGTSARLLLNIDEFAAERFLSNFQADVEALTACVKRALKKQLGIGCKHSTFCFGDYSIEADDRWAWTIVDFKMAGHEVSFVVSAREQDGMRLYCIEADNGILEDVRLEQDAVVIFDFLKQELLS
jgi:hypothetical protein